MCDDPRNPHRLRFDSGREEQKTRWKCQIILDMDLVRKARFDTQEDADQRLKKKRKRSLSPPTGNRANNMVLKLN